MKYFRSTLMCTAVMLLSVAIVSGQATRSAKGTIKHSPKSEKKIISTEQADVTSANDGQDYVKLPAVPVNSTKAALHNNGPFITHPGGGPGGADWSQLDEGIGLTSWGSGHAISANYSVAEDILVNATSWTIDSLVFYCYQTGSTTTSTINDYRVQIWDGNPNLPGSTVVWGDLTTNRLTRTGFSNCYRGSDPANSTRPIMRNVINTSGLVLTTGDFYIQWQAGGTLTSGPWANPIAIMGQAVTGNALQFNGTTWANLLDGANGAGLPFEVYGTAIPLACPFPTNLTATNIADISASLGWTENGAATLWNVEYGPAGFTQGTGTTVAASSNPYSLTGLTAGTDYEYYVQADCGGGSTSIWMGPYAFSTGLCPLADQCAFGFALTDSWGDGWNGASLFIVQNGVTVANPTMSGDSAFLPINLCTGIQTYVIFDSGAYNSECGLYILDPWGQQMFYYAPGVAPADGDTLYSFVTNCTPPSCIWPNTLGANTITDVSANITWNEQGTATLWNVEYGITGFTQGSGVDVIGLTTEYFALTGLTPGATYDFYVQADCGGGDLSNWAGPFSFQLLPCPIANQCNYVFNFTDSYGDGWNGASVEVMQNGNSTGTYTLTTGFSGSVNAPICDGASVAFVFHAGAYDSECGLTISDPFGGALFSFAAGAAPADGATMFSTTGSCTPPTCPAPTTLGASGMTTTSANLSWTEAGTATTWNIEYGPAGFTQGSGTDVLGVTANPYALSGLATGSAYDFYVQADCGSGDLSFWTGPYTFNTACDIINAYPWFDDFESGIPCWSINGLPTVETWYLDDGSASTPLSGTHCMTIEYDPTPANQDQWLYSPVFDFTSVTNPQITFNWNMSYYWGVTPNDNYDMTLEVTTNGGTTWTPIWTEPTDSFANWTWFDTTLSLGAYTGAAQFQFAIRYVGNDGAAFYLDDVLIDFGTSTQTITTQNEIRIFPNPTTGIVRISNAGAAEITVMDILGKEILKSDKAVIDLSDLPNGTYLIRVSNDEQTVTQKINLVK